MAQINLTQEDIEKRCVEYEEKLTFILQRISFLAKYKLVSVKEIKVIKSKVNDATFHHVIDLLNQSLINDYFYVDNSIKLNQFELGVSISYALINSVKRTQK
jgi:hypothetical protein